MAEKKGKQVLLGVVSGIVLLAAVAVLLWQLRTAGKPATMPWQDVDQVAGVKLADALAEAMGGQGNAIVFTNEAESAQTRATLDELKAKGIEATSVAVPDLLSATDQEASPDRHRSLLVKALSGKIGAANGAVFLAGFPKGTSPDEIKKGLKAVAIGDWCVANGRLVQAGTLSALLIDRPNADLASAKARAPEEVFDALYMVVTKANLSEPGKPSR